jgi:opacity protein-like surface antigen
LFGRFSPEKGRDTFAYLGVGAGAVYSTVTHGSHDWGWGYQLLGGISVPIVSRLRLRLEGRYILTGDVDTATGDRLVGWKVDTSGTPTRLRKNETVDTRFMPIIIGLDWRF